MLRSPQRPEYILDKLKDKYGRYVIYLRTDRRYPCSCRDPDTEEVKPKCTICLGLGYKISIEIWPMMDARAVPQSQEPFLTDTSVIGRIAATGHVFYAQRELFPRKVDRILDVEWTVPKHSVKGAGRVHKLLDAFEINDIYPIRSEGGEVQFHQIYCKTLEIDYAWLESTIKSKSFARVETEYDWKHEYSGPSIPTSIKDRPVGEDEPPVELGLRSGGGFPPVGSYGYEDTIPLGTTGQFYRGDKSWASILLGNLSLDNYKLLFGTAGVEDVNIYRSEANILATDDDFAILSIGRGMRIKEGTNARQGVVTLVDGEATVDNTSVTANSRILLTSQDNNTVGILRISARIPGVSFTITSSNVFDSGEVSYFITEPA